MFGNKYSSFLTVLLVIIVIAVVVGLVFLGITIFKPKEDYDDAIARFDSNIQDNSDGNEEELPPEESGITDIVGPEQNNSQSSSSGSKKQYYSGYVMVGYIEISKTNIKYPILEKGTDKSLEVAVAVMYPDNPTEKLNKPGNVVIMGHNYRNGKFFSNNKKLETGDKIVITDYTGTKVKYTIYEKFETTSEDSSFISRNTNGKTEITLSTCTDDTKRRLIIKARAD